MKADELEHWIALLTTWSFVNNLELYYSTEEPLNVTCLQTLRNCYKPSLSGHSLLSRHMGRSLRCPLNRAFTVIN